MKRWSRSLGALYLSTGWPCCWVIYRALGIHAGGSAVLVARPISSGQTAATYLLVALSVVRIALVPSFAQSSDRRSSLDIGFAFIKSMARPFLTSPLYRLPNLWHLAWGRLQPYIKLFSGANAAALHTIVHRASVHQPTPYPLLGLSVCTALVV